MFAESPDLFFLKVVDAEVTFDKDASGQVNQLTIHQGGRDIIAKKISDTAATNAQHKEISIAPEKLREYVGSYALTPGFILTVTWRATIWKRRRQISQRFPSMLRLPTSSSTKSWKHNSSSVAIAQAQ